MPFSPKVREEALVRSKRCCCVCQEFAGRATNIHHIEPDAGGGSDEIENAIVLCLRCHSEAGHYNAAHPIGNKYSPSELLRHRDDWWQWCKSNPATIPPKYPIQITPVSLTLHPGKWTSKTEVIVSNTSSTPWFQVWIKATILAEEPLGQLIDLKPCIAEHPLSVTCGGMTVSGEVLGIFGSDIEGRSAYLVRLFRLDPGASCAFLITLREASEGPAHPIELGFSVVEFSDEPPQVLEQSAGGKIAMVLKLPMEGFTVESIGIEVLQINPA